MSHAEHEKVFLVEKMWSEGLRPATASRLWGYPSRNLLSAWEKEALAGALPAQRPRPPRACEHRKHGRYPAETRAEAERLLGLGKQPHQVAAVLGVEPGTVAGWGLRLRREARRGPSATPGEGAPRPAGRGARVDAEERTRQLEAELAEANVQVAVLREVMRDPKAGDPASLSARQKVECGERLRRERGWPLRRVLTCLGISKSTYEYNLRLLRGPREGPGAVDAAVRASFEASGGTYGYRRVAADTGVPQRKVRESMRRQGLRARDSRACKRLGSYRGEVSEAPKNLLVGRRGRHRFHARRPNQKWVTDISEARGAQGAKVYLSVIVDLYDGRVVACQVSEHPDAELANATLRQAIATLAPGEAPVIHSDRGAHYRWDEWVRLCGEARLVRSMSRKGHSPDNAACEGFFGRLKVEVYHSRDWSRMAPAEMAAVLKGYCAWYNGVRLKSFKRRGRRTRVVYETIDGRRRRLGHRL